jgi:poly-gamma-glutamate synthesis protein (capsule biosynthesis protein)
MASGDVRMALIGDAYVQRPNPDSAFDPARPYFEQADIVFCNLETVVADEKYLPVGNAEKDFPRTDESTLGSYLRAGINVMNVANNPVMYQGLGPFLRSLDVLDQAGVVYGGGGRNLAEARKPAIIERGGTRVAFVCRTAIYAEDAPATPTRAGSATVRVSTAYEVRSRTKMVVPGVPPIIRTHPHPEDVAALEEDIHTARQQADVVVSSWHWGMTPVGGLSFSAGGDDLVSYQIEMGHRAIDFGADLVVGHHPHVVQPIEVYKGRVIAYCLGSYAHDKSRGEDRAGVRKTRKLTTILLRCVVHDGHITEVSFVPGRVESHGPPEYVSPSQGKDVVDRIQAVSAPFGTRFEVGDEDVQVVL